MNVDKLINYTIPRFLWGVTGLGCLSGALFYGAWWHFFTAAICLMMFLMHSEDDVEPKDNGTCE